MHDNTASNYLRDLGDLVRRAALDAKVAHSEAGHGEGEQFTLGRLSAFHEVVSLMQQQAVAFDLDLAAISLDGIDPDRDLL